MMSIFERLFSRDSQKNPQPPEDDCIHIADIPLKTDTRLTVTSYPQKESALTAYPLSFFRDRYAENLRRLLSTLPFNKTDAETLIAPVLTELIATVHLLPASKSHHHWGSGGLLVHSLDCATHAAHLASRTVFKTQSPSEKYHNRPRWILAAAMMALVHDVGKVLDMTVFDEENKHWNPNTQSLLSWLKASSNRKDYFFRWNVDRSHKQHELRSIRLAYQRMFPFALIQYLADDKGAGILGAMEEAIVFSTGPLSKILSDAETQSINDDMALQSQSLVETQRQDSALIHSIFQATQALLQNGRWKVNTPMSAIFYTDKGLFIKFSDADAQTIREACKALGNDHVPGTAEGLLNVLHEAELLDLYEGDPYWPLTLSLKGKGTTLHYAKLRDPYLVFNEGAFPSVISATIVATASNASQTEDKATTAPIKNNFLAPTGSFGSTLKEQSKEETKTPSATRKATPPVPASQETVERILTDEELQLTTEELQNDKERETFIRRLIATVIEHIRHGGQLAPDRSVSDNGEMVCSSQNAEIAIENRGIDIKTVDLFVKLYRAETKLQFDMTNHLFILKERDKL